MLPQPLEPGIHDLDGVRSATPNALGIEGTAIPTDHGHGGMLGQPVGDEVRRALGQEVKPLVILEINEDRAIALPTPPRPLIDPQHLRGGRRRRRGCLHQPQQGGGTGAEPQPAPESCARLPAESEAAGAQALREPQGAACPRCSDHGQTCGENLTGARGLVTKKLAHTEVQVHRIWPPWQISQGAAVPTMDPWGERLAARATDPGASRRHLERELHGRLIEVPPLQG